MTILDLSNKEINDEIIKKLLAQLKNLKNIQGIKLNNNKSEIHIHNTLLIQKQSYF